MKVLPLIYSRPKYARGVDNFSKNIAIFIESSYQPSRQLPCTGTTCCLPLSGGSYSVDSPNLGHPVSTATLNIQFTFAFVVADSMSRSWLILNERLAIKNLDHLASPNFNFWPPSLTIDHRCQIKNLNLITLQFNLKQILKSLN